MITQFRPLLLLAALTAAPPALVSAVVPSIPAADTPGEQSAASAMIARNTRSILDALSARRAEFSRDRSALRDFVTTEIDAIFDRDYSARLVLGIHARGADPADVALFADALAENLLQRYGSALLDFNTRLEVRMVSETNLPGNRGVRVSSQLLRRNGDPIALDYLLRRQPDGQWKVFDVMIEGISMVQTFRQQFDAELRRKSIREVAAELRGGQLQVSAD